MIEEVREYLELEGIKLKELVAAEFDLDKLNYKFDEDWDIATDNDLSHRPDLKLMDLRIQDEKLTLKEVNSSWKPEIILDSNYYVGKRELQFTQDDWDVSLSFSWEIFDFGTRKASQKLQEIEIKRLEYSKKELEIQLGATWKSLKNQFKNRIKRLDKLKIANDLAIENFKEHQREFKKGLINSIELTRSQDELIESELLYEKLKYQIAEQASAMNAFMGKTKL